MHISREEYGVIGTWTSNEEVARWTGPYYFHENLERETTFAERRKNLVNRGFERKKYLLPEIELVSNSSPYEEFDFKTPGALVVSTMFMPVIDQRVLQGCSNLRISPSTYEEFISQLATNFLRFGCRTISDAYASAMVPQLK